MYCLVENLFQRHALFNLREGMDARLAGIDARRADIDARRADMDARGAYIDARLADIDARLADMDARLAEPSAAAAPAVVAAPAAGPAAAAAQHARPIRRKTQSEISHDILHHSVSMVRGFFVAVAKSIHAPARCVIERQENNRIKYEMKFR